MLSNCVPAGLTPSDGDIPLHCPRSPGFSADRGPMNRHVVLVPQYHALRVEAEACINAVYERVFGTRRLMLPRTLIVWLDDENHPVCAAGLRTAADGFFSEAYLDAPIEQVLAERSGTSVRRGSVFEITTLASRNPEVSSAFLRELALVGQSAGFQWSFFTATARLRDLLRGLGIPAFDLAPADALRLPDPERWGSYYAHDPQVCAVGDEWLGDGGTRQARIAPNA